METTTQPATSEVVPSFEDYQASKLNPQPKADAPSIGKPADSSVPAETAGESVPGSDTGEQQDSQESQPDKPRRDERKRNQKWYRQRAQLAEQSAEQMRKHNAQLLAELEQLRTGQKAETPKPATTPDNQAEKQPSATLRPGEPDMADPKYEGPNGMTQYFRDLARFDREESTRLEQAKQAETAAQERSRTLTEKWNEAFSQALKKDPTLQRDIAAQMQAGLAPQPLIDLVLETTGENAELGIAVASHLARNPDDTKAVLGAQNPVLAYGKLLARVEARLPTATIPNPSPQNPKPVVRPTRVLSGGGGNPGKRSIADLGADASFEEYKAIRGY